MPASVSELSRTDRPSESANETGRASRATRGRAVPSVGRGDLTRPPGQAIPGLDHHTTTGTETSWISGTTPAFMPLIAAKHSAKAAGRPHDLATECADAGKRTAMAARHKAAGRQASSCPRLRRG